MNRPQIEDMTQDMESTELMERPETATAIANRYMSASALALTKDEKTILNRPANPETECEIRPDGLVFMSQVHYRRRLNEAFGQGQWCLMPTGGWVRENNQLFREYALFVRGCFVAEAVGEAEYKEKNPNMTWATATEAVKSDALKRCCKDLGIASECWDKRFTDAFIKKYCVHVYRREQQGKARYAWRRKDAEPFWDEGKGPEPVQQPQRKSEAKPEGSGNSPKADPVADEAKEAERKQAAADAQLAAEVAEADRREAEQQSFEQGTDAGQLDWAGDWLQGLVSKVHEKSGQTNGKDWTRLGASVNGVWHNTFKPEHQRLLKQAYAEQRPVWIKREPARGSSKGFDVVEVRY